MVVACSWDEETKMSLMISRHWGTTLYENLDEDDTSDEGKVTCALGEDFVMAMNSTVEVRAHDRSHM